MWRKLHRPNYPFRLVHAEAVSRTRNLLGWNRQAFLYPISLLIGVVIIWRWRDWEAAVDEVMVSIAFAFAPLGIVVFLLFAWNLFHGLFIAPPPAQVIKASPLVAHMPERNLWQRTRYRVNRFRRWAARAWRVPKKGF